LSFKDLGVILSGWIHARTSDPKEHLYQVIGQIPHEHGDPPFGGKIGENPLFLMDF
jgi:hypothetical protein